MKKMLKVSLIIVLLLVALFFCIGVTAIEKASESVKVETITNAADYSRLTKEALVEKLGQPETVLPMTNAEIYNYHIDTVQYEFVIWNGYVARMTLYSEKYWIGSGEAFEVNNIFSVPVILGIQLEKGYKTKETPFAYRISQPTGNIASIDAYEVQDKTCGYIKVTYDTRAFE